MGYYRYRLSSGEVFGCSTEPLAAENYSGVFEDTDHIVFGGKIYVDGSMRDATPSELAGFAGYREADKALEEKDEAYEHLLTGDTPSKRVFRAFVEMVLIQINDLRGRHGLGAFTLAQVRSQIKDRIDAD